MATAFLQRCMEPLQREDESGDDEESPVDEENSVKSEQYPLRNYEMFINFKIKD